VTALLDAAALVQRFMGALSIDDEPELNTAIRLLVSHARESEAQAKEFEAWKRLALSGWFVGKRRQEADGALRALGIDPMTGERIAADEPR
jgi:hypothetical protein